MPISDPRDRFLYPHHTPMKDTYYLSPGKNIPLQLSELSTGLVVWVSILAGGINLFPLHIANDKILLTGFIRVREMSGKFKIFQGQGIVREFHNLSGKIEFLLKCQGNVREF